MHNSIEFLLHHWEFLDYHHINEYIRIFLTFSFSLSMMLEWIYSIFVFLGLRHTSSNGSMTKIPHSGGSSNNHGASTLGDISMGVEGQALLASSNGTCLQPKRTRRSRIPDKPNISFRSVMKISMKRQNITLSLRHPPNFA